LNKKLLLILLLIILAGASSQTSVNASVSAPDLEWQREYEYTGNIGVESATNLIQTSDGGYAFLNHAWGYQSTFKPSTLYKVDTSGIMQWNKTIPFLSALTLIQTNDEGYEISGYWSTYGIGASYKHTPTLVKTDVQGNIQWVKNYSSVPDLGVASTSIQTSDGGYACLQFGYVSTPRFSNLPSGGIIKTDSNNNTQWVKNLTYTGGDGTFPLVLSSLIETSDGALAGLGVGLSLIGNPRTGKIYLIKTESFLPLPTQNPLPTPMTTPAPEPSIEVTTVILAILVVIAVAVLLLFLKKRKG
jgi:hypothetical protein